MFGQLLRDSDYMGDATYTQVVDLARQGLEEDPHGLPVENLSGWWRLPRQLDK